MISLFKKNIPGYGFDAFGYPVKYRSSKEAGALSRMPNDGLVFYAPLNNTSGFNVTGNPQITRVGKIPCMYFDGSTYLETTASRLPQGNSPRTVSLWISISQGGRNKGMVGYGTYTSNQMYGFGADGSGYIDVWCYDNDANFNFRPEYETFYHMAIICDPEEGYTDIYVNGERWDGDYHSDLNTTGTSIWVGSEAEGNGPFVGHLAAVRVYNRVLTEEEIKILSGEFAL